MKSECFECECGCNEHRLIFSHLPEDLDTELYLSIFLKNDTFWRRLKRGIKYVFGFKCKFGHFDEAVLGKEEIIRLINFLQEFLKSIKHD